MDDVGWACTPLMAQSIQSHNSRYLYDELQLPDSSEADGYKLMVTIRCRGNRYRS